MALEISVMRYWQFMDIYAPAQEPARLEDFFGERLGERVVTEHDGFYVHKLGVSLLESEKAIWLAKLYGRFAGRIIEGPNIEIHASGWYKLEDNRVFDTKDFWLYSVLIWGEGQVPLRLIYVKR